MAAIPQVPAIAANAALYCMQIWSSVSIGKAYYSRAPAFVTDITTSSF
jgi:hypothetical protein